MFSKKKKHINEEQIIFLAKKDRKNFNILYTKYYEKIFLFILRRYSDEDVAADITQQTFVKAMINLEKFEFRGLPFSSWLYRISLNELNLYFRETKKRRSVSLNENELHAFNNEQIDKEEEIKEIPMEHLITALNVLTDGEVTLLEMKYFEKRSHREISEILGISESNAKVKLHRIIKKMRKAMV